MKAGLACPYSWDGPGGVQSTSGTPPGTRTDLCASAMSGSVAAPVWASPKPSAPSCTNSGAAGRALEPA